jgi:hypothetical protein
LGIDIKVATTFRNFPTIPVKREAMLADEICVALIVDRHDAYGQILEVDGAIDPGPSSWREHIMMRHAYPSIVVSLALGDDSPGAFFFSSH